MTEVFINVNKGFIKWWGPNTTGSNPFRLSEDCPFGTTDKDEVLGRTIKCLMDLARSRGEDWSFRISRQLGV